MHTYAGSGAQVYAFNTKVAPFDDVRVRQALVMALDRKKMSQAITNGLARPGQQSLWRRLLGQVQGRRCASRRP